MKTAKPQEYAKAVKAASPPSPVAKDCILAFLTGGFICTIGQVLCNLYQNLGLKLPQARMAVSISLILISATLTALGWYDDLSKHAGAGMLVPITGFANAVVSPAIEFKAEGWINGTGAKMFLIAGPVIVYGMLASVAWGILWYLLRPVLG